MIRDVRTYVANKTISKRSWLLTKRNQYKAHAGSSKRKFQTKYQDVVNRGEISQTLATYLLELGRNAALLATHTIVGRYDDAKRNHANLNWYFNKIHGKIYLVAMNFILGEAKILSQTPK